MPAGTQTAKRNPERTTRIIRRAALSEFSKVGYEAARVDRIAARSRLSKGLIYHYFGSKDELFLAVLEDLYGQLREENDELILEDVEPEEGIRRLISHTFDYFVAHPEFIVLVNSENIMRGQHVKKSDLIREMFKPLVSRLGELVDRGVAMGLFRDDVDITELYISIVALGYFPLSNRHSLGVVFGRDLVTDASIVGRKEHIQELILGYLRATDR